MRTQVVALRDVAIGRQLSASCLAKICVQATTGTDPRVMPDGTPRLSLTLAAASDVGRARDQGVAVAMVDPNGPAGSAATNLVMLATITSS